MNALPSCQDAGLAADRPGQGETAPEKRISVLSLLLANLDEASQTGAAPDARAEAAYQGHLARARLGLASSLFTALQAKHRPTATHGLRVALGCSSWALWRELDGSERDELEVAALLHDIGKIGVPDHVLLKPGKLTGEELVLMERHRQLGRDILRGCCTSLQIPEMVYYASAWFDGRQGFERRGEQLPLGSRMIAIVDAFDAMTTDHVYRSALSRERALGELFEHAGTQFDPELVQDFCKLLDSDRVGPSGPVAPRWLEQLPAETACHWLGLGSLSPLPKEVAHPFHQQLLDSMHDGVVFVDSGLKILLWNRGAERLTGLKAVAVQHKAWEPGLVKLRDEEDQLVTSAGCPVVHAIGSGVQTLRRLTLSRRPEDKLAVNVHVVPVLGQDGVVLGATLLLHDASKQSTLEERVQSLRERAARDPLTKVANRAEFDRTHKEFVETHLKPGLPCSLIICDLDFFKSINDTYGHQAGDEALIGFAALLQRNCRQGDLVARYGGEEFVMLCADCDNATAARRAEQIRQELAALAQPMLNHQRLTASFGVTELQHGDTPETMLRRADRALMQAKDSGRNLVVQLGTGLGDEAEPAVSQWWGWFRRTPPDQVLQRELLTPVPLNLAVEKLRGFVADHHAEIASIEETRVALKIDGANTPLLRRQADRPVPFFIELAFEQLPLEVKDGAPSGSLQTWIQVTIRPKRHRDRRRQDVAERARQLLQSLKAYLMAHERNEPLRKPDRDGAHGALRKARSMFSPWLRRKAGGGL